MTNVPGLKADFALTSFKESEFFYTPLHVYGAGNVLCFEMSFESPNLAGNTIDNSLGRIQSKATLYEDFADNVSFWIYKANNSFKQIPSYPNLFSITGDTLCLEGEFAYYKRVNEIFHLNYGIAFLSKNVNEVFIGNEFLSQNGIIPNNKFVMTNRELFLYTSENETYGINDRKALGDRNRAVNITFDDANNKISFSSISTIFEYTKAKSWCIGDGDGNIYFAVNQEINIVEGANPKWETELYYLTRKKRL